MRENGMIERKRAEKEGKRDRDSERERERDGIEGREKDLA